VKKARAAKRESIEKQLIRAMEEAVEIKEGKRLPAKEYFLTALYADAKASGYLSSKDIVRIRHRLGLSQAVFAKVLNVSAATARSWEQNVKPPSGPAKRLLEIAATHPSVILSYVRERPRRQYGLNARAIKRPR
jgi:DNA-binding transcriptional regulator YiaG